MTIQKIRQVFLLIFLISVLSIISWLYWYFDVPSSPLLVSSQKQCHVTNTQQVLPVSDPLDLMVWNIYKEQISGWEKDLSQFSQNKEMVLLQEVQSSPEFLSFIQQGDWFSEQAIAFALNKQHVGVMTLSKTQPVETCAYLQVEPYLRLPKSALFSRFALSNGQHLLVINVHGVNFTPDTEAFERQFRELTSVIGNSQDPVIFAGDLNTWSEERTALVKKLLAGMGLQEMVILKDKRTRVFDHPLDHIFYRGLVLESATTKAVLTSDHTPLLATFRFINNEHSQ